MKKGWALITVLTVLFVIFAILGAFLFLTTNARLINERYHQNMLALYLAEAGADYAIWEINYGGADFSDWAGNPAVEATKIINNIQDSNGNVYGNVSISLYNFGQDIVTVRSVGTFISLSGPQVSRTIQVLLKKHKLFQYAILTSDTIDVDGTANKVDSYNSVSGPYGGSNIGEEGNIVTNGQGTPAVTLRGGATIDGDVATGPGGTISTEGGATYSGAPYHNAEVFMPPVIVPGNLTSSILKPAISLAGSNSLELFTGDYKYESLTLSSKAQLILNGNVNLYFTTNPSINTSAQSQIIIKNGKANIYFDGNVSLAGQGAWNQSGVPSDLSFYGTDSVSNISLAGIGAFYGSFYAPGADYFYISGNSEMFGSVVGKNVSLTGTAQIHFDEQLLQDSPTMGYEPYSWEEK